MDKTTNRDVINTPLSKICSVADAFLLHGSLPQCGGAGTTNAPNRHEYFPLKKKILLVIFAKIRVDSWLKCRVNIIEF